MATTKAYFKERELKPCPFCGCDEIGVIFESNRRMYIVCPDCGCSMTMVTRFGIYGEKLADMLKRKWNTRKGEE